MKKLKTLLKHNIILLLLILIIILSFIRLKIPIEKEYNLNDSKFIGYITDINYKSDKISFILKGKEKLKCIYYLDNNKLINLKYGDRVIINGVLKYPINNTIPNTFNYKKYLYNNNINFILTIKRIKLIRHSNNIIFIIKNKLEERIKKIDTSGYLETFILGNKNYIDDEAYNSYIDNGIIHLLSISGMHISILSLIILSLLNKIRKSNINIIIVIILLLFYLVITNYQPSIIRSIIFFSLLNFFKILKLKIDQSQVLLISIMIILLIFPNFLYNSGFQYSSIISYSLIKYRTSLNKNYYFNLIAISLLALLISLPITINMNYKINILSILLNIIFVPLVSIIIYPLSLISLIFPFFIYLFNMFIFILEKLSIIFSNIKILTIYIPKLNIFEIIIYYLIILLILNKNRKYILILILFIIILKNIRYLDTNYYVTFLDVNQGDSALIIYKKECIMIDTGGSINYDNSKNIIKYLNSISINKIDLLVLTHGDYDHIGNAKNLLNKIKVKRIMLNKGNYNDEEKKLLNNNIVDTYNTKIKFYTLKHSIKNDENLNSIINYLEIYNTRILFMGDAPKIVEQEILSRYNLNLDIIKLGHHGSNTSSDYEFLRETSPKIGIISSGRNNLYHHPSKETINTLNKLKIKYYNTQTSGTIIFKISKKRRTILTYPP